MKEKVLIVDDEKDIVRMLDYNLKKEGYRTVCASDGEEALEKARREHPDLILLDLMLPGVDGL
jgi:DNA-binding response OmpR family regulator